MKFKSIKNITLCTLIIVFSVHTVHAEIVFKKPPSKTSKSRIQIANHASVGENHTDIEWSFYDITGTTVKDIYASLETHGPVDPKTNKRVWALSRWNINWSETCDITLKTHIKMPRLSSPYQLSVPDLKIVQDMLVALKKHEIGHHEIALKTKEAMQRDKCHNQHKINNDWSKKQSQYDLDTNHGANTGVDLR